MDHLSTLCSIHRASEKVQDLSLFAELMIGMAWPRRRAKHRQHEHPRPDAGLRPVRLYGHVRWAHFQLSLLPAPSPASDAVLLPANMGGKEKPLVTSSWLGQMGRQSFCLVFTVCRFRLCCARLQPASVCCRCQPCIRGYHVHLTVMKDMPDTQRKQLWLLLSMQVQPAPRVQPLRRLGALRLRRAAGRVPLELREAGGGARARAAGRALARGGGRLRSRVRPVRIWVRVRVRVGVRCLSARAAGLALAREGGRPQAQV